MIGHPPLGSPPIKRGGTELLDCLLSLSILEAELAKIPKNCGRTLERFKIPSLDGRGSKGRVTKKI